MSDSLRAAPMPAALQTVLLILTGIAAAGVLAWSVLRWVRHRDTLALWVILGTQLAAPYEGLGDRLLHVYYPELGQIGFLHAFGRDVPLFVQLLYLPYIVPFVVFFIRRLQETGFTRRTWWTTWALALVSTNVMEMVVLQFGPAWIYYDNQPAVVFGIPVWVALTNTTFLFSIATAAYAITARTPRRVQWLVVPATATCLAAGHAVVASPMHLALSGHANPTLIQFASLVIAATIAGLCWKSLQPLTATTHQGAAGVTPKRHAPNQLPQTPTAPLHQPAVLLSRYPKEPPSTPAGDTAAAALFDPAAGLGKERLT